MIISFVRHYSHNQIYHEAFIQLRAHAVVNNKKYKTASKRALFVYFRRGTQYNSTSHPHPTSAAINLSLQQPLQHSVIPICVMKLSQIRVGGTQVPSYYADMLDGRVWPEKEHAMIAAT
jgi:hypothetical protein